MLSNALSAYLQLVAIGLFTIDMALIKGGREHDGFALLTEIIRCNSCDGGSPQAQGRLIRYPYTTSSTPRYVRQLGPLDVTNAIITAGLLTDSVVTCSV